MEKSYFKCFRLFLDTWKKITDVNLKAQYYESLLEYWLNGTLPNDPIIDALLTSAMYSIDRSDEIKEQKSEYMKGNQNAVKTWENISKQRKTDKNREEQTKTYEEKKNRRIEDKEVIEDIEDNKKEKLLKRKYLDFVSLTEEEHEKLVNQFWLKQTNELIDRLNNYIWSTGKRYKSHYFTILNRAKKELPQQSQQEMMKERERQRIREEAQAILSHNKNQNGESIQTEWYNRRSNFKSF